MGKASVGVQERGPSGCQQDVEERAEAAPHGGAARCTTMVSCLCSTVLPLQVCVLQSRSFRYVLPGDGVAAMGSTQARASHQVHEGGADRISSRITPPSVRCFVERANGRLPVAEPLSR